MDLARGRLVVGEAPFAAQQRVILDAPYRIAASEATGLQCGHG
jgi:hypothetical protein